MAAFAALGLALSLSACAGMGKKDASYSSQQSDGKILGIFGGSDKDAKAAAYNEQAGIGVNAYLWRASLDTISFMPLNSADPWGGVIISDWYANPQKPDERFKTTIYILDSRLRADALNVSVYKQVQQGGQWIDADVSQQTQLDIENAILTRARELRLSDVKN
ncbi:hypothetical protein ABI_04580 [Asticcacaulis biprosthecium C19]|uniref:DUF3576 domain-containing protein n=1 Tax=Asticcacaulis biprosthecium C19 TaxID=715226 RepID=F4QJZ9_9CAUL|nr:hypothetical protein ABI_04580 [Asticcacaulis biprosthecium C19]